MLPVDPALTLATDGSFPGLLCAYGWAHRAGRLPSDVVLADRPADGLLFGAPERVETEAPLAGRLERGIERVVPGLIGRLFRAFLSERPGIEVVILRVIDAVAADGAAAASDWTFEPTRVVSQWSKRVGREAHRMEAFVRFEKHEVGDDGPRTADDSPSAEDAASPSEPDVRRAVPATLPESGDATSAASPPPNPQPPDPDTLWLATARPEVHVLPLIGDHFATRYPAMRWAIVDDRRGLALLHDTPAAALADGEPPTRIVPAATLAGLRPTDDERAYQTMWRAYFRAVDIPERKNLKLHLRHVPKRYWPYLTEKREAVG